MTNAYFAPCRTAAFLAMVACSSSSPSSPSVDAKNGDVDGGRPDGGGVVDASQPTVNGCTPSDFADNDRTANDAERVILAPEGPEPAPFSPRCMRVRMGQTVTWKGDLASHPLSFKLVSTVGGFGDAATVATIGDEDGNPTQTTMQANEPLTISVTCDDHPAVMFGAVDVVR